MPAGPKVSKLAANDALREYVQERLAGSIARPSGEVVAGPDVRFVGRRHGRRADRRNGNPIPGVFTIGKRYRFTFGAWSECVGWGASVWIFEFNTRSRQVELTRSQGAR